MRRIILFTIISIFLASMGTDIYAQDTKNADAEYLKLDEFPTFRGGTPNDFALWVARNIKYPKEAKAMKIEGIVKVRFGIGLDGKISEAYIEQGLHPLLEEEAIRVIKKSPKWKPAMQDGHPVKVSYTLPVIFGL